MMHRLFPSVCLLTVLALLAAVAPTGSLTSMAQSQSTVAAPALKTPGQAPAVQAQKSSSLMFIENVGQFDEDARFQVRGAAGGTAWLAEDAIWLTILEPAERDYAGSPFDPERFDLRAVDQPRRGANIKLSFVGANPHPVLVPFNPLNTVISYFLGNDPDGWRPDVPVWGGVRYVDLYPGVDLEVTGEGGELVPRLAVRASADLSAVRLRVEGVESVTLDDEVLRLSTAAGDVAWPLLQMDGSSYKATVQPRGRLTFDVAMPFALTNEDRQSVVTSPYSPTDNPADLLFGTFLGGDSAERGDPIVIDASGAAYVSGWTHSSDFPITPGAFDTTHGGSSDGFIVRLNPAGTGLDYATFLGGSSIDHPFWIAVDAGGAVYVTGSTGSSDFPTTPGAFDSSYNGADDGFIVKLNAAGTGLVYATYLGGSSNEHHTAIAVDAGGAAYVMGETGSTDFPTTPGAFDASYNGSEDAYVVKLNPSGSALAYSTFLGGSDYEYALGITVDAGGAAYVTGETGSTDFPTTSGALDTTHDGSSDGFVVKLNAAGMGLDYATLLGGSDADIGFGIAVDSSGATYVTGDTRSSDFPTTFGAFDTTFNGAIEGFVVKLNAAGTGLVYSTFLGGSSWGGGNCIAVDAGGAVYVTGSTGSSDFPTTPGAFDSTYNGEYGDAFVVKLNPAGTGLDYATFLGGSDHDYAWGIAVAAGGAAYVTGLTYSSDFPTTQGAFDTTFNGGVTDAFVVLLAMGGGASVYSISGHASDASGGNLEGVTVSAGGYSAITDANGNYVIGNVPAGVYTLSPSRAGYTFTPSQPSIVLVSDTTQNFTASAVPPDCSGEWRAEYFDTVAPDGTPAVVRCDPAIDFYWGDTRPSGMPTLFPETGFSVRWQRVLSVPLSGLYRFRPFSDDAIRLYVDGTPVFDSETSFDFREGLVDVSLSAGDHEIVWQYAHGIGESMVQVGSYVCPNGAADCLVGESTTQFYQTEYPDVAMPTTCATAPDPVANRTIASNGCLISSYAMMLQSLGINTDPVELNEWLSTHEGYSGGICDSYLKRAKIEQFASEQYDVQLHTVSVRTLAAAKEVLRNRHLPVIYRAAGGAHYFLAIDVAQIAGLETLGIRDPHHAWACWAEAGTTAPFSVIECAIGTLRHRTDLTSYAGAAPLAYLEPTTEARTSSLQFNATAVELLLTDTEGRRVGYDQATGETLSEIPNSLYYASRLVPPGEEPLGPEERTLFLPEDAGTIYTLQVIGLPTSSLSASSSTLDIFEITVVGFDSEFATAQTSISGSLEPGQVTSLLVSFEPGESITLTPATKTYLPLITRNH